MLLLLCYHVRNTPRKSELASGLLLHGMQSVLSPFRPDSMPHLPFTCLLPSFAVTDERGANALHDADGLIIPQTPYNVAESLVKRRATAIHNVDHSLPLHGSHRPQRVPKRPTMSASAAFCGTIGQKPDGFRVSAINRSSRPNLAQVCHGESFSFFADMPSFETPSPAHYEPATTVNSTRRAPNASWRGGCDDIVRPKMMGHVKAAERWHDSRSRAMPHVSSAPRLVDTTPVVNHANIADGTPGPGSYPLSEFSDFAPRPRTVRSGSPAGMYSMSRATSVDGFGKEHASVRGCTSSFGTSGRSDICETWHDRGMVRGMPEGTRTPGGATHAATSLQDRVYMTYKGSLLPPTLDRGTQRSLLSAAGGQRFTKQARSISMSELRNYSGAPHTASAGSLQYRGRM